MVRSKACEAVAASAKLSEPWDEIIYELRKPLQTLNLEGPPEAQAHNYGNKARA